MLARQRVLSRAELATHVEGGSSIYLAILGHVFDVTKGSRFYTGDSQYAFFAGKDATRAFVTGAAVNVSVNRPLNWCRRKIQ